MTRWTIFFAVLLWVAASLPIGMAIGRWLHRLSDPAPFPRSTFKCPKRKTSRSIS